MSDTYTADMDPDNVVVSDELLASEHGQAMSYVAESNYLPPVEADDQWVAEFRLKDQRLVVGFGADQLAAGLDALGKVADLFADKLKAYE